MMEVLNVIIDKLNTGMDLAGSILTFYDYIKTRNGDHIQETLKAIREKSKEAYDLYCEYQQYRKNDIGIPNKEDILDYWESCLNRDVMPSVGDMVAKNIACKQEAEIMFPYLLEAWLEIPDFAEWVHGILIQNKLDDLAGTIKSLQKNFEAISLLSDEIRQQDLYSLVIPLSSNRVIDAKYSCCDSDVKRYFTVNNDFNIMLKVICSKQDIPYKRVNEKLADLVQGGNTVIIAGNGGLGKTSLMMHVAVQWVSSGNLAVWLPLSNKDIITEQKADALFNYLIRLIPEGQRMLLCIDNPFEGRDSFISLQKMCPDNTKIQLIMAERVNRLTLLADSTQDALLHWFDDAKVVLLQGSNKAEQTYQLKDYETFFFLETKERRREILEKFSSFLVKEEIITERDKVNVVNEILNRFGRPAVSLVELIYRALFEFKKVTSKPEYIKMDWEEWGTFIHKEFGEIESSVQLYGVIAAFKIFNMSLSVSLFCKHFNIQERKMSSRLYERMISRHIEPVIYNQDNETLQPKHDVIAELFFLFNKDKISINRVMLNLLDSMDEIEIEKLLDKMVIKKEMNSGNKYNVGTINYWQYMEKIYKRIRGDKFCLSKSGVANLCLGFLWSREKKQHFEADIIIEEILNKIAPEIENILSILKLYTEWGIWLVKKDDYILAEEKFREVIKIDTKNIMSRTELGKLLSKQKGREKEAEEVLREAIRIEPKNLPPKTELGKLLSKQKGREKEAEEVLREVIKIDYKNLHARIELAELYKKCDRQHDALLLYQEVCKLDPGNPFGERGLFSLKQHMGENDLM